MAAAGLCLLGRRDRALAGVDQIVVAALAGVAALLCVVDLFRLSETHGPIKIRPGFGIFLTLAVAVATIILVFVVRGRPDLTKIVLSPDLTFSAATLPAATVSTRDPLPRGPPVARHFPRMDVEEAVICVAAELPPAIVRPHAVVPSPIAELCAQARAVVEAARRGDAANLIDSSLPCVVAALGGRDSAIRQTAGAFAQLKLHGFAVVSSGVERPAEPIRSRRVTYCVVPTWVMMTSPHGLIRATSFLLGVTSDGGRSWRFADGAGLLNARFRSKVFPKLPDGLRLPVPTSALVAATA